MVPTAYANTCNQHGNQTTFTEMVWEGTFKHLMTLLSQLLHSYLSEMMYEHNTTAGQIMDD